MNVAQLYIDTASDGRSPDTPLVQVAPGHEPPMFTQHFRGWDPLLTSKTTFVDPYQAKLEAAKAEEVSRWAWQKLGWVGLGWVGGEGERVLKNNIYL